MNAAVKKSWTTAEIERLRRGYPDEKTEDVAREFGRSAKSVNVAACRAGIKKSACFFTLYGKRDHPEIEAARLRGFITVLERAGYTVEKPNGSPLGKHAHWVA